MSTTIISYIAGNTTVDNTTAGVAASAITSPVWLPILQSWSEGAAMLMPLLGVIWLLVQIISKVKEATIKVKIKDKEPDADG